MNRILIVHQYKFIKIQILKKNHSNFHSRIKKLVVIIIKQIFSKIIIKIQITNLLIKNPSNLKIINKKSNNLVVLINKR